MNFTDQENHLMLRVPPQSVKAEQSVIGSLLLNNKLLDHITDILTPADFYRSSHQQIFKAISYLVSTGSETDVITVYEYFGGLGRSEEVGGLQYLNELSQFAMSPSSLKAHAQIIRDKSILRQLANVADEISASAFTTSGLAVSEVLDEAEKRVLEIGEKSSTKSDVKSLPLELQNFIDELTNRADNPDIRTGVHSGFSDLDELTDGFQAGDLIVIAGRPSMGKTTLALNIANHASFIQKLPVLVFSLEMTAAQLISRSVCAIGGVDGKRMKTGALLDYEWGRVSEAMEKMKDRDLDIEDSGASTISAMRATARRTARKYKGLGLIVVDYIQLMTSSGEGGSDNRATEVAQISRGLKLLAKEMSCPVIALSQLNRELEKRPNKRPLMSDLRESGAIEQDADTIMFVYRDEVYTLDKCQEPGVAEIIIGKQRNGPTGMVRLAWNDSFTRFSNLGRGG